MAAGEPWIHHRIPVTEEIAEQICGKCGRPIGTAVEECFEYNRSSEPSPLDAEEDYALFKDPAKKREYRHAACLYPNPDRRP